MDLYIARENGVITLDEWLSYTDSDGELKLAETGTVINPLTKSRMKMKIPGRAVWRGEVEIIYRDDRLVCEDGSEETVRKLTEIAAALSASLFDCGEKIYP